MMHCTILYNKSTPDERWATDMAKSLDNEGVVAELLDADSSRGIDLAEHYDITARPALLIAAADGTPVALWQGREQMPLVSEIAHSARQ